jgi:hypothetical protein
MYLFYVDESGAPYSYSPTSEFFVLSTIIIQDVEWDKLNAQILALKRKYFPSGDLAQIEIKGSDIWNSLGSFDGFDDAKIDQIMTDLGNLIASSNLRIISTVVKKQLYIFYNSGKDMLNESWKYLLERIEMFLTGEGKGQHGLVIMDSINRDADKKKDALLDGFKMLGTGQVNLDHILEITFTDSGLKNMIQLTDVVAYIVNLHMRQSTQKEIDPYWKQVESKFRRDHSGNYLGVGFKVIP